LLIHSLSICRGADRAVVIALLNVHRPEDGTLWLRRRPPNECVRSRSQRKSSSPMQVSTRRRLLGRWLLRSDLSREQKERGRKPDECRAERRSDLVDAIHAPVNSRRDFWRVNSVRYRWLRARNQSFYLAGFPSHSELFAGPLPVRFQPANRARQAKARHPF
jgi:hypothetical protein